MKLKKVIQGFYPAIVTIVIMLTSGCTLSHSQQAKPIAKAQPVQMIQPAPSIENVSPTQVKSSQQEQITFCRQALDSLQKVNPSRARKLNNDFNALVNAASQYNSVRGQVGDTTRQAIDSMYHFKSIKLCADIDKELMDSLVVRGESSIR
ncbi:MAG TPA: hypothetical protein VJY31_11745 [Buttiauxella sp.]|nr:hypothetical protein [Buttiauxella sp.]